MEMARLLRLIILLNGLIALAVLLARLVGSQTPLAIAPLFTHPDGTPCELPCLFGIRPGETSGLAAFNVLRAHPLTRGFDLISSKPFRMEADADQIMMISFNVAADGIVDEITLTTYVRFGQSGQNDKQPAVTLPPSGSLGDILSLFGTPDFVQMATGGDPLLIYVQAKVAASLLRSHITDRHLLALMPLNRLTFYRLEKCTSTAFNFVFLRWLGITSFPHYAFAKPVAAPIRRIASAGTGFVPCLP